MRLLLPPEFLPCIDDPGRLLAMADYVEDHRDGWRAPDCPLDDGERAFIGQLLRWTANEWRSGPGVRRAAAVLHGEYRLRIKMGGDVASEDPGYRRIAVTHVGDHVLSTIRSDSRWRYRHQFGNGVAWWDLTPYVPGGKKPKRRNGYATKTNAALAEHLCESPDHARHRLDFLLSLDIVTDVLYQPMGELAEPELAGNLFK